MESKEAICALMQRGLWDIEDVDEYDKATALYEDFCLDGYPLHAIDCPQCEGRGGVSWVDSCGGDECWHTESCPRCKGRGVIRVSDETEAERGRRAEKQRPKPSGYQVWSGGILAGRYRFIVAHGSHLTQIWGDTREEARALAEEWVQAALSNAAAGTQPTSPPSPTT